MTPCRCNVPLPGPCRGCGQPIADQRDETIASLRARVAEREAERNSQADLAARVGAENHALRARIAELESAIESACRRLRDRRGQDYRPRDVAGTALLDAEVGYAIDDEVAADERLEAATKRIAELRETNRALDEHAHADGKRIAELEAVVEAARPCGTHPVNDDTCGVCGLHFAECEAERASDDDSPDATTFPACPGARVRLALAALSAKPSEKGRTT